MVKAGLTVIVNLVVIALWAGCGAGYLWPAWVLLGTSAGLAAEAVRARFA